MVDPALTHTHFQNARVSLTQEWVMPGCIIPTASSCVHVDSRVSKATSQQDSLRRRPARFHPRGSCPGRLVAVKLCWSGHLLEDIASGMSGAERLGDVVHARDFQQRLSRIAAQPPPPPSLLPPRMQRPRQAQGW